jgi:HD-like signal output (HDOD) protein
MDHAQVGGRLLIHWQFPEPIAAGVAHHHQPDQAGSWAALAACVNLGEALALAIEGPPDSPVILQQNGAAEALRLLQLSPDQLLRYRYLTLENFEFVNALCRL